MRFLLARRSAVSQNLVWAAGYNLTAMPLFQSTGILLTGRPPSECR
jgi:cation transport ATPase